MINMTGNVTIDLVYDEVKSLKKDIDYIKKHMVNVDLFLTTEEEVRLEETLEAHARGETTPLEEFRKKEC